ncbi:MULTISPECIES: hypothetical protein [Microbacterium]|uniref:Uncharacterized protein n=1 Tax=Microbacterium hominis TaxID=162426 RepID=A0A2K9DVJ4_9MICO|nr:MULTISPECIES: hypothetical protein [Microbacterium]AUG29814.1 hypothetical protein CXR34_10395 [Microbacterium hominis]
MSAAPTSLTRVALAGVVVVANAAAQAALVAVAPRQPLDAAAIALAVVSGVVLGAAAAALWVIAQGRFRARTVGRTAVAAVAVALFAVAAPVAIPVVVAIACPVIAADRPVVAGTGLRRHPWRTALHLVLTALAVVLASVVAMLLGLLAPGAIGSAAAWLIIGAGAAVITGSWQRWARRAESEHGTRTAPASAQP